VWGRRSRCVTIALVAVTSSQLKLRINQSLIEAFV